MSSDETRRNKRDPPTIFQVLSYNIDKKVCSRIDGNTHLGKALLPFCIGLVSYYDIYSLVLQKEVQNPNLYSSCGSHFCGVYPGEI